MQSPRSQGPWEEAQEPIGWQVLLQAILAPGKPRLRFRCVGNMLLALKKCGGRKKRHLKKDASRKHQWSLEVGKGAGKEVDRRPGQSPVSGLQ